VEKIVVDNAVFHLAITFGPQFFWRGPPELWDLDHVSWLSANEARRSRGEKK